MAITDSSLTKVVVYVSWYYSESAGRRFESVFRLQ